MLVISSSCCDEQKLQALMLCINSFPWRSASPGCVPQSSGSKSLLPVACKPHKSAIIFCAFFLSKPCVFKLKSPHTSQEFKSSEVLHFSISKTSIPLRINKLIKSVFSSKIQSDLNCFALQIPDFWKHKMNTCATKNLHKENCSSTQGNRHIWK